MPRPKVPPSQRRRAAEACNACREAKKRCTGTAPCTHCLKRGVERDCFITYAPRGSAAKAKAIGEAQARASSSNQTNPRADFEVSPLCALESSNVEDSVSETQDASFQPLSPSDSRAELQNGMGSNDNRRRPSSSASTTNCPRMLLNLRGERGRSVVAKLPKH
jgi:hypothetical protein